MRTMTDTETASALFDEVSRLRGDAEVAQADLRDLLLILGMGDYARPQSPHEVFQEALAVLRTRLIGAVLQYHTGDVVQHKPSGELWTVAYADPESGRLAAFGWPASTVQIDECRMFRKASRAEHIESLSLLLASGGQRAATALRIYGDPKAAA